ncbi:hypothetical protein ACLOJK_031136 [Asimina triloba]
MEINFDAENIPQFPRVNVWDPYKRLGVSTDASEEEIRGARNFLLQQYSGHERSVESIEAAYEKIIMASFKARKKAKITLKSRLKKQVEESPSWVKKLFEFVEGPPADVILRRLFLNDTIVALSLASCIFFLNDKSKNLARASIIGFGALVIGWVCGSFIGPTVPSYVLQRTGALELITALVAYAMEKLSAFMDDAMAQEEIEASKAINSSESHVFSPLKSTATNCIDDIEEDQDEEGGGGDSPPTVPQVVDHGCLACVTLKAHNLAVVAPLFTVTFKRVDTTVPTPSRFIDELETARRRRSTATTLKSQGHEKNCIDGYEEQISSIEEWEVTIEDRERIHKAKQKNLYYSEVMAKETESERDRSFGTPANASFTHAFPDFKPLDLVSQPVGVVGGMIVLHETRVPKRHADLIVCDEEDEHGEAEEADHEEEQEEEVDPQVGGEAEAAA